MLADHNAFGNTYLTTITSTIKESLRNGGGISEAYSRLNYEDCYAGTGDFWQRYAFELTNYIII